MEFIKDILLAETPWMAFKEKVFRGISGELKHWTYVERKRSHEAVCVIATNEAGMVAVISQPRPPTERVVWEFPAGLVDVGESLETAALRELKEETGASGEVLSISPQVYSTPGLTSETISFVEVKVIAQGIANPEPDEEIVLKWIARNEIYDFISARSTAGDGVDAKLWLYGLMQRKN